VDDVIKAMVERGREEARTFATEAIPRRQYKFDKYVYAFATLDDLIDIAYEKTLTTKNWPSKFASDGLNKIASRKAAPAKWRQHVEKRFALSLEQGKDFDERWFLTQKFLRFIDSLLSDIAIGEDRLSWFLDTIKIPKSVAKNLQQDYQFISSGGPGKGMHVLFLAYHFLKGPDFSGRSAVALAKEDVLKVLKSRVALALSKIDIELARKEVMTELGFRRDLLVYLQEQLHCSWSPRTTLKLDSLAEYIRPKRKRHPDRYCSICNRYSSHTQQLRTNVFGDEGQIFSNRTLPVRIINGNRPWCPTCHLEFIFRKLTGLGLPSGAHYKNSYRIYLYVLPTFSFTPEHLRLFRRWLHQFQQVTNLPVRDYGQDAPGLPRTWLERRELDPDWVEALLDILRRQTERIGEWGGQSYVGEHLSTGQIRGQPHYYLITWEKAARESEIDDARIATRTEAWAKALFVASTISGLTSCKIYVTERPYLPVVDPAELKPTITLDGPPPALRGLLGGETDVVSLYGRERDGRSGLERVLDLSAALWTVTADVHAPNRPTKDKHIAGRLGLLNVSHLAGATFYKEYSRLNDGRSPHRPLEQGGELMNLVEQIAEKSLAMALPRGTSGRGKARRYEVVFREGVEAMRKAFALIPELRRCTLTGEPLKEETLTELKSLASGTLLKALERRQQTRRGEIFVRAWGPELSQLTGELIDLLVDEVFLNRAGGSFARFLRLENSLADGIYYYTDQNLSRLWEEYNQQKAARQAEATNNPQE
jgi:hypothetical protein